MASAVLLRALGAAALRACLQAIACPARSPLKALSVWRALQPALVVAALRAWRLLPAPVMAPPAGPRPKAAMATAWQPAFAMATFCAWRRTAALTSTLPARSRPRAPSALSQWKLRKLYVSAYPHTVITGASTQPCPHRVGGGPAQESVPGLPSWRYFRRMYSPAWSRIER